MQHETVRSTVDFDSSSEKKTFEEILWIFFIVKPFTMQDALVIWQSAFEIFINVRFVSIKSVRIVDLVAVNVQFCIRKNGMQNIVHMSNMRHSLVLFYKSTSSSLVSVKTVFSLCPFFFPVVLYVEKPRPLSSLVFRARYICRKGR